MSKYLEEYDRRRSQRPSSSSNPYVDLYEAHKRQLAEVAKRTPNEQYRSGTPLPKMNPVKPFTEVPNVKLPVPDPIKPFTEIPNVPLPKPTFEPSNVGTNPPLNAVEKRPTLSRLLDPKPDFAKPFSEIPNVDLPKPQAPTPAALPQPGIGEALGIPDPFQQAKPQAPLNPVEKRPMLSRLLEQTGNSLIAGTGGLIENIGQAEQWVGKKIGLPGMGQWFIDKGQEIQEGHKQEYNKPITWKTAFDPEFYTTAIAESLPTSVALLPAAIVGGTTGGAIAAARGITGFGRAALQAMGAGAASAPLEASLEAADTYKQAKERGMSDEDADNAADKTFWANLGTLGITNAAEFATAFIPGAGRLGAKEIAGRLAGGAAQESLEEGAQESIQRWSLGDEIAWDDNMKASMLAGGIMGAGFSGAGILSDLRQRTAENLPEDLQGELNRRTAGYQQQGMTPEQAQEQAMEEIIEHPAAQEAVQKAIRSFRMKGSFADLQEQGMDPVENDAADQVIERYNQQKNQLASLQKGDQVEFIPQEGRKVPQGSFTIEEDTDRSSVKLSNGMTVGRAALRRVGESALSNVATPPPPVKPAAPQAPAPQPMGPTLQTVDLQNGKKLESLHKNEASELLQHLYDKLDRLQQSDGYQQGFEMAYRHEEAIRGDIETVQGVIAQAKDLPAFGATQSPKTRVQMPKRPQVPDMEWATGPSVTARTHLPKPAPIRGNDEIDAEVNEHQGAIQQGQARLEQLRKYLTQAQSRKKGNQVQKLKQEIDQLERDLPARQSRLQELDQERARNVRRPLGDVQADIEQTQQEIARKEARVKEIKKQAAQLKARGRGKEKIRPLAEEGVQLEKEIKGHRAQLRIFEQEQKRSARQDLSFGASDQTQARIHLPQRTERLPATRTDDALVEAITKAGEQAKKQGGYVEFKNVNKPDIQEKIKTFAGLFPEFIPLKTPDGIRLYSLEAMKKMEKYVEEIPDLIQQLKKEWNAFFGDKKVQPYRSFEWNANKYKGKEIPEETEEKFKDLLLEIKSKTVFAHEIMKLQQGEPKIIETKKVDVPEKDQWGEKHYRYGNEQITVQWGAVEQIFEFNPSGWSVDTTTLKYNPVRMIFDRKESVFPPVGMDMGFDAGLIFQKEDLLNFLAGKPYKKHETRKKYTELPENFAPTHTLPDGRKALVTPSSKNGDVMNVIVEDGETFNIATDNFEGEPIKRIGDGISIEQAKEHLSSFKRNDFVHYTVDGEQKLGRISNSEFKMNVRILPFNGTKPEQKEVTFDLSDPVVLTIEKADNPYQKQREEKQQAKEENSLLGDLGKKIEQPKSFEDFPLNSKVRFLLDGEEHVIQRSPKRNHKNIKVATRADKIEKTIPRADLQKAFDEGRLELSYKPKHIHTPTDIEKEMDRIMREYRSLSHDERLSAYEDDIEQAEAEGADEERLQLMEEAKKVLQQAAEANAQKGKDLPTPTGYRRDDVFESSSDELMEHERELPGKTVLHKFGKKPFTVKQVKGVNIRLVDANGRESQGTLSGVISDDPAIQGIIERGLQALAKEAQAKKEAKNPVGNLGKKDQTDGFQVGDVVIHMGSAGGYHRVEIIGKDKEQYTIVDADTKKNKTFIPLSIAHESLTTDEDLARKTSEERKVKSEQDRLNHINMPMRKAGETLDQFKDRVYRALEEGKISDDFVDRLIEMHTWESEKSPVGNLGKKQDRLPDEEILPFVVQQMIGGPSKTMFEQAVREGNKEKAIEIYKKAETIHIIGEKGIRAERTDKGLNIQFDKHQFTLTWAKVYDIYHQIINQKKEPAKEPTNEPTKDRVIPDNLMSAAEKAASYPTFYDYLVALRENEMPGYGSHTFPIPHKITKTQIKVTVPHYPKWPYQEPSGKMELVFPHKNGGVKLPKGYSVADINDQFKMPASQEYGYDGFLDMLNGITPYMKRAQRTLEKEGIGTLQDFYELARQQIGSKKEETKPTPSYQIGEWVQFENRGSTHTLKILDILPDHLDGQTIDGKKETISRRSLDLWFQEGRAKVVQEPKLSNVKAGDMVFWEPGNDPDNDYLMGTVQSIEGSTAKVQYPNGETRTWDVPVSRLKPLSDASDTLLKDMSLLDVKSEYLDHQAVSREIQRRKREGNFNPTFQKKEYVIPDWMKEETTENLEKIRKNIGSEEATLANMELQRRTGELIARMDQEKKESKLKHFATEMKKEERENSKGQTQTVLTFNGNVDEQMIQRLLKRHNFSTFGDETVWISNKTYGLDKDLAKIEKILQREAKKKGKKKETSPVGDLGKTEPKKPKKSQEEITQTMEEFFGGGKEENSVTRATDDKVIQRILDDNRGNVQKAYEDAKDMLDREEKDSKTDAEDVAQMRRVVAKLAERAGVKEPENVKAQPTKFDAARDKTAFLRKHAELARKRLDSKKNNLNSLPMSDLVDYAIIGASKLADGIINFAEWSDAMIQEFGGNEKLRKYLKAIYAQSEEMVENPDLVIEMIEETQGKEVADSVRREMGDSTPEPEENVTDEIARIQKLIDEKKQPLVKYLKEEYKNGSTETIRKQVRDRGGIKSNDLKEEYKNIPLSYKNRNGLSVDQMADELRLTERQLIDALTGKNTSIDFDVMADRMLKDDEEVQALKKTLRSLKGEETPQEDVGGDQHPSTETKKETSFQVGDWVEWIDSFGRHQGEITSIDGSRVRVRTDKAFESPSISWLKKIEKSVEPKTSAEKNPVGNLGKTEKTEAKTAEYDFNIKKSIHTKHKTDIWVVSFTSEDRLSTEEYKQVLSRMKKIEKGAYWSKFKPNVGFIFTKDPTNAIAKEFGVKQEKPVAPAYKALRRKEIIEDMKPFALQGFSKWQEDLHKEEIEENARIFTREELETMWFESRGYQVGDTVYWTNRTGPKEGTIQRLYFDKHIGQDYADIQVDYTDMLLPVNLDRLSKEKPAGQEELKKWQLTDFKEGDWIELTDRFWNEDDQAELLEKQQPVKVDRVYYNDEYKRDYIRVVTKEGTPLNVFPNEIQGFTEAPKTKEDPRQAAIGVISGGKVDRLEAIGLTFSWEGPHDKNAKIEAVGEISGGPVDQLIKQGIFLKWKKKEETKQPTKEPSLEPKNVMEEEGKPADVREMLYQEVLKRADSKWKASLQDLNGNSKQTMQNLVERDVTQITAGLIANETEKYLDAITELDDKTFPNRVFNELWKTYQGGMPNESREPGQERSAGAAGSNGRNDQENLGNPTSRNSQGSQPAGASAGTSGGSTPANREGNAAKAPTEANDGLPTASGSSAVDQGNRVGAGKSGDQRPVVKRDFVITDELDDLGGAKTKFKQNVTAIRLVYQLEQEGRLATPDEQAILAKYVGWGGLSQAFKEEDKTWDKEIAELKSLVTDGFMTQKEYENMRNSAQFAHYTSKEVVGAMYQAIEQMGFKGGRVLEPAMGTGNFFGLMPGELTSHTTRIGVEYDSVTGKIAKHLYQKATIHIKGFEDFKIADGFFDLAIGNPPFSSAGIADSTYKEKYLKDRIHNYFFVKSLDKVREGGIVAFVTSAGALNSNSYQNWREWIGERADFLGAIRLPGDAFKKNAGTEVTTDIIFLQKRPEGQKPNHADPFFETVERTVKGRDGNTVKVSDNEYFMMHPEMILGELTTDKLVAGRGGERLGVKSDGRDFTRALQEAVARLPRNIYQPAKQIMSEEGDTLVEIGDFNLNSLEDGGFGLKGGQIVQRDGDTLKLVKPKDKKTGERIQGMIKIRDTAAHVLKLQRDGAGDKELQQAQKILNAEYDLFVKKHGYLNAAVNKLAFKDDVLGSSILQSLEDYAEIVEGRKVVEVKAKKMDLFHKRTIQTASRAEKADTAQEALVISMFENARIDFEHMERLTGKDRDTLIQELGNAIYQNPRGGWETEDEYLSGNVREKLAIAREAAEKDRDFERNVQALEAVQPAEVGPDEIYVKLGSPWVPASDVQNFVNTLLKLNDAPEKQQVKISHSPLTASWTIDAKGVPDNNTPNTEEFGVKGETWRSSLTATEILEYVLNLKQPVIGYTDEDGKYIVNQDATLEAQQKASDLQEAFSDWIWNDVERTNRLVEKYNQEYNATRLRQYEGEAIYGTTENPKPIPGYASHPPRKHQKNAVWRQVQGGNTLLAHVVGAGKTLEMIIAGAEMKRLGLINKPVYVVPNLNFDQWEKDFRKAYPAMKLLKLSSDSIPAVAIQRREVQEELDPSTALKIEDKVKGVESDNKRYFVAAINGDKITLAPGKQGKTKSGTTFVKLDRKKQFTVDRKEITHRYRKMNDAEFQELRNQNRIARGKVLNKIAVGDFDAILITHTTFEKLPVSPELVKTHIEEQVKMIEEAIKSMKDDGADDRSVKELENAKDRLRKRLKENIDEDSKDVAIPFEMLGIDQIFVDEAHYYKNLSFYTKMTRLAGINQRPAKRAEDMFLKTRWLSRHRGGKGVVFATGTPIANSVSEMYTMKRYLAYDRLEELGLTHFDAWAGMFGQTTMATEMDATGGFRQKERFANFMNVAEMMRIFKDFADIQTAETLDLPRPKNVKYHTISPPMSEGQRHYLTTLQARAAAIKDGRVKSTEDNWLNITTDGRKAALDLRLVAQGIIDSMFKMKKSAKEIADAREELTRDNPQSKINLAVENIHRIWKETTAERKDKFGEPIDNLTQLVFLDLGAPKAKEQKEDSEDQTEEADQTEEEFSSVYEDIKNKLIKLGIPAKEVAMIHEAKTGKQREQLYEKVRQGKVRVLIGSTAKLGVGVNVQDRLVALHHLDAPWRPADHEQREGRIIRQGNRLDDIEIYNYTTEGSFDAIMWDTLRRKASFIAVAMNASDEVRTIEDVGDFVAGYAHVAAVTSGDTTFIEKAEVDAEIYKLQKQKKKWRDNKTRRQRRIAEIPKDIKLRQSFIQKYELDMAKRVDRTGDNFQVTIEGTVYTDRKEAGEALLLQIKELEKAVKEVWAEETFTLGEFAGFPLKVGITKRKGDENKDWYMHTVFVEGEWKYKGDLKEEEPARVFATILSRLTRLKNDIEREQEQIKEYEKEQEELSGLLDESFKQEDRLNELVEKEKELNRRLLELNKDKQAAAAAGETEEAAPAEEEEADEDTFIPFKPGFNPTVTPQPIRMQPKQTRTQKILGNLGKAFGKQKKKDTVKRDEVIDHIQKYFEVPIRVGLKGKEPGRYKRLSNVIRLKHFNDFVVIHHEMGHRLDQKYDLSRNRATQPELENLAQTYLTIPPTMSQRQVLREGVALFTTLYVYDRARAMQDAPLFYDFFEQRLRDEKRYDYMMQLIDLNDTWHGQSAGDRIDGVTSIGESRERKVTKDNLYTLIYDELRPLQMASEVLSEGRDIPASQDPFKLAWQNRGVSGKIDTFLNHAVLDAQGNVRGESLKSILDDVDDIRMFRRYLQARHAITLRQDGKTKTPITMEDAKKWLGDVYQAGKTRQYKRLADRLYQYKNRIVEELIQSGMANVESLEEWNKKYPFHVPFYRVMEESVVGRTSKKRFANLAKAIKAMKKDGSSKTIIDPLESIIKDTYLFVSMAERNKVGRALVDLAQSHPEGGFLVEKVDQPMTVTQFNLADLEDTITDKLKNQGIDITGADLNQLVQIFKPAFGNPLVKENVITVWEHGKATYYKIGDPELYAALTALDPETFNIWKRIFSVPNNVLRTGITASPAFIPKGPMRAFFTMLMQSEAYTTPMDYARLPFDFFMGVFHAAGQSKTFYQWKNSGAAQSTLQSLGRDYMQENMEKLLQGKWYQRLAKDYKTLWFKSGYRGLRKATEVLDEAARIAEYRQSLRKGMDPTQAAINSREVDLDFSRFGRHGHIPNSIMLFFNITLQGPNRMIRTWKKNPLRTLMRGALFLTVPTLLLAMKNYEDDDYWELEQWERDLFWNIPIGEGKFFKIPIPFEWGLIFKVLPERIYQYIREQDPKAFKELGKRLNETFNPISLPTAGIPFVEWIANINWHTDKPVVPESERYVPKSQQFSSYTSETAKLLGETLDQSPRKIDQAIRSTTGGLGQYGVAGIDKILGTLGRSGPPKPAGEPGILERTFVARPADGNSASITRFYEEVEKLEGQHKEKGIKGEPSDELRRLRKGRDDLAAMRALKILIYDSQKMNPQAKRNAIDKINKAMTDEARFMLREKPGDLENLKAVRKLADAYRQSK